MAIHLNEKQSPRNQDKSARGTLSPCLPLAVCFFLVIFSSSAFPAPASALEVRTMSFNLWVFRGDVNVQSSIINQDRPDVLGVQEAIHSVCNTISSRIGMPFVGLGRDGGNAGEFTAIYYDSAKFNLERWQTLWLQSSNRESPGNRDYGNSQYHRTFTYAVLIEKSSGTRFYFYNTHLDHLSGTSRVKSAEQIIEHMKQFPWSEGVSAFITGDMNTGWGSLPAFQPHLERIYIDGIDWIAGDKSTSLAGNTRSVRNGAASDHPMIVADVRVRSSGGSTGDDGSTGGDGGDGGGDGGSTISGNCVFKQGVDFNGNDIKKETGVPVERCCSLCESTSNCAFYTWGPYEGGTCYLKDKISGLKQKDVVSSGSMCGFEYDVDYDGTNISEHNGKKGDDCCLLCKKTNGCEAFTWTDYKDGTCWLKKDVKAGKPYPGAISGGFSIGVFPKKDFPEGDPSNTGSGDGSGGGSSGGSTISGNCVFKQGVDFNGNDIKKETGVPVERCCSLCESTSNCAFYTWGPYEGGTCYLKDKISGLKQKDVVSSGSMCGFEYDVDYDGTNISEHNGKKGDDCCLLCKKTNGCEAFTWTDYKDGTCWLKKDVKAGKPYPGAISGGFSIGVFPKKDFPEGDPSNTGSGDGSGGGSENESGGGDGSGSCYAQDGKDFYGNDIASVKNAKAEECCELCEQNDDCVAYTWGPYDNGTCFLKSAIEKITDKGSVKSGTLFGYVYNEDLVGEDIGNSQGTSSADCTFKCKKMSGCEAFTWTDWRGGTCWFKKGITGKKAYSGAISGGRSVGSFPSKDFGTSNGGTSGGSGGEPTNEGSILRFTSSSSLNDWDITNGIVYNGNGEQQIYKPENVWVENNVLKIKAERMSSSVDGRFYRSGKLVTKREYLFGTFNIRARVPMFQGSWPAIWTLPTRLFEGKVSWPEGSEMDIMEGKTRGGARQHISACHWLISSGEGCSRQSGPRTCYEATGMPVSDVEGWHVYHLKWEPDKLTFWVDDKSPHLVLPYSSGRKLTIPQEPHKVILNLAVGGNLGGDIRPEQMPGTMEVDYVQHIPL
eukprot:Nk52_evm25s2152 gene=Nk52_evmTU25s2152